MVLALLIIGALLLLGAGIGFSKEFHRYVSTMILLGVMLASVYLAILGTIAYQKESLLSMNDNTVEAIKVIINTIPQDAYIDSSFVIHVAEDYPDNIAEALQAAVLEYKTREKILDKMESPVPIIFPWILPSRNSASIIIHKGDADFNANSPSIPPTPLENVTQDTCGKLDQSFR